MQVEMLLAKTKNKIAAAGQPEKDDSKKMKTTTTENASAKFNMIVNELQKRLDDFPTDVVELHGDILTDLILTRYSKTKLVVQHKMQRNMFKHRLRFEFCFSFFLGSARIGKEGLQKFMPELSEFFETRVKPGVSHSLTAISV